MLLFSHNVRWTGGQLCSLLFCPRMMLELAFHRYLGMLTVQTKPESSKILQQKLTILQVCEQSQNTNFPRSLKHKFQHDSNGNQIDVRLFFHLAWAFALFHLRRFTWRCIYLRHNTRCARLFSWTDWFSNGFVTFVTLHKHRNAWSTMKNTTFRFRQHTGGFCSHNPSPKFCRALKNAKRQNTN